MEETNKKKLYVTPSITITTFRLNDVIMTSSVENHSGTVIDDGGWDNWDGQNNINDPLEMM